MRDSQYHQKASIAKKLIEDSSLAAIWRQPIVTLKIDPRLMSMAIKLEMEYNRTFNFIRKWPDYAVRNLRRHIS